MTRSLPLNALPVKWARQKASRSVSALRNPEVSSLDKAFALSETVSTVKDLLMQAKETYRQKLAYTVAVGSNEELYPYVQRWLTEQIPSKSRRSMRHSSSAHRSVISRHFYEGSREQIINLDGHWLTIQETQANSNEEQVDGSIAQRYRSPKKLVFTSVTIAGRDAALALLDRLAEDNLAPHRKTSRLCVYDGYSGWDTLGQINRPFETVVLPDGMAETLKADLDSFKTEDTETRYEVLGLPYHRGYLFHGPPGTGKTSIAKAIATHLRADLNYLPLASRDLDDSKLTRLFSNVSAGEVVLLEDIDTLGASRTRGKDDTDSRGITLAGLLNVLDGVGTPHGVVIIMTTNRYDAIDPALLRPGRADRTFEVGLAPFAQAVDIWRRAFPGETWTAPVQGGSETIAPSEVVEVIKEHLYDPEGAAQAIVGLYGAGLRPLTLAKQRPVGDPTPITPLRHR